MQVKFVRSGGLAGLEMVAKVDTVDLPTDQQDLVAKLLADDVRGPASQSRGADQFSYQLEIQHAGRKVRRRWDEPEVPETVRPLLATLTRQAKPAR